VKRGIVYLDSSAIIKLVFEEEESAALCAFLVAYPTRATSVLAQVEVLRTIRRVQDLTVARDGREVLDRIHVIRADDTMLAAAADIEPSTLRSLDAIHLVTALSLRPNLSGIVVYDRVLADAAGRAGLTVWAPA
jgi:predicted nucleic acid-binding protein